MKGPAGGLLDRVVGAILHLYPAAFRERFGGDIRQHVRERWSTCRRSPARRLRLLVDLAAGGVRERLGVGRGVFTEREETEDGDDRTWATNDDDLHRFGGDAMMGEWRHDVADAFRRIARAPVFSVSAIVIVALGMGVNVGVFTVANAFLLRPPAYADPDRVVDIYQDSDDGDPSSTSFPAYRDIATYTDVFSDVGASMQWSFPWEAASGPRQARVEVVTSTYFRTLGLTPALGRDFEAAHDRPGAGAYAIVSYRLWSDEFSSDPGVLGRSVRLNGRPVTIIGVGPRGYAGYDDPLVTDFFLSISSTEIGGDFFVANLDRRQDHWYQVQARLRPEVTVAQAQDAMTGLARRLGRDFPELNQGRDITVFGPGEVRIHPESDADLLPVATGLFAVAALILVLACSNLANLLLVRGLGRRPEVAVRRAFGAGRWRIARTFVIESVLIAALGGLAGVALAAWGVSLVPKLPMFGGAMDLAMDLRVFVFAAALVTVTGVLFGLAPAIDSSRISLADTLRESPRNSSPGRRTHLVRNALVAVQVCVSLVLLVGATLMVRSFEMIRGVDTGFEPERLAYLTATFTPAGIGNSEGMRLMTEFVDRMETIPGVESAALTTRLPARGFSSTTTVVDGYDPPSGTGSVELSFAFVSEGFFETAGIPVVEGRAFNSLDTFEGEAVVMVNETAAERFWQGDALGGRLRGQGNPDAWNRVVGVAGDSKVRALDEPPTPMIYFPIGRTNPNGINVVVRATGDPETLLPVMRRELAGLSPSPSVGALGSFDSLLGDALAMPRLSATVAAAFSVLALLLASLGIYAVVSFTVARRTAEMGIRAALGAGRARLMRSVAGQTVGVAAVGVALGLGLTWLAAPLASGFVYGLPAFDPVSVAVGTSVLTIVAVAAAYVPARRAAVADPVRALRSE